MKLLARLQKLLEHIYQVDLDHDVSNFVFSDPTILTALCVDDQRVSKSENLLIHEQEDELQLSLYLDSKVLGRLRHYDPTSHLHLGNLNDFWVVLEGVSHLMYVVRRAASSGTFSLLELEMQAEVDKFVASSFLIKQQDNKPFGRRLHQLLFEAIEFDQDLNESERKRYLDANQYAGRYCWYLNQKYLSDTRGGLADELRDFYRLPHQAKIRRIDGGVYGGGFGS